MAGSEIRDQSMQQRYTKKKNGQITDLIDSVGRRVSSQGLDKSSCCGALGTRESVHNKINRREIRHGVNRLFAKFDKRHLDLNT